MRGNSGNKIKKEQTIELIKNLYWDKYGKGIEITKEEMSELTKIDLRTIKRYWKEII